MKRLLERGFAEETKPLVFGIAAALAAQVAGYAVAHAVSNSFKAVPATIGCSRGLKDELPILQNEQPLANIIPRTSRILIKASRDEENQELIQTFAQTPGDHELVSPINVEAEGKDHEKDQEIAYLKELVQELREREENLELQLLTYDGIREQEAAVRELEDRLRVSSAEAECLRLELKSLQDENQKLKLQASEHLKTGQELELTKAAAEQLERRLAFMRAQAKGKIALLQQKVIRMLDEQKNEEDRLNRLKKFEDEAAELRRVNSLLAEENADLKHQILSASISPSSTLETIQTEILEEISQLREENEELKNKIKQLKEDRFADLEELVYLRWLNACLRYELRNRHELSSGKTVARDHNKSFSPQSEQIAGELILDYANECIRHEKTPTSYNSSERSTDQCDETHHLMTKDNFSKRDKFFGKLKKMMMVGKKNQKSESVDRNLSSLGTPRSSTKSVSSCSTNKVRRHSDSSIAPSDIVDHLIRAIGITADDDRWHGSPWIQASFRSPVGASKAGSFDFEGEERKVRGRKE